MCGMPCLQQRKTPRRFTSCTRCQDSRLVSITEPSSVGLIPALFISTSIRPYSSTARSIAALTSPSSATLAAIVSPPTACSASRSIPTTVAPSCSKRRADSAPIPLAVPVITAILPANLPGISTLLGRVIDVLQLGVVLERVGTELAADARLLEAAERGRDPHRAVRVDRDHAGLDRPRDAQCARPVAGPDRAGKAVDRVVGERDRLRLAAERDHRDDRAEDLLAGGAVVVGDRGQHNRREPEAVAVGGGPADRDRGALGDEGGDRLALPGGDQWSHLRRLVERVADLDP